MLCLLRFLLQHVPLSNYLSYYFLMFWFVPVPMNLRSRQRNTQKFVKQTTDSCLSWSKWFLPTPSITELSFVTTVSPFFYLNLNPTWNYPNICQQLEGKWQKEVIFLLCRPSFLSLALNFPRFLSHMSLWSLEHVYRGAPRIKKLYSRTKTAQFSLEFHIYRILLHCL